MQRVIQRRDIVERNHSEAGHQRLKALMVFLLAGRTQRRERASVERAERREDLEAAAANVAAPSPRELDRGFVGLGARVAEENFPVAEMIREPLGQSRHRLGVEDVGDVRELFGLLLDRAHDARISMAEAGHGEPAEKIQVAVAVGVIEIGACAAHERERQASVDIDHVLMGEFDDFGVVHRALPPSALRAVSLKAETLARR